MSIIIIKCYNWTNRTLWFLDLIKKLIPGDLLVFNNTRVIPARLYGYTITGRNIEIFIERILSNHVALAYIRTPEIIKLGMSFFVGTDTNVFVHVIKLHNNNYYKLFEIYFHHKSDIITILDNIGHIPIPPYLKRLDEAIDYELYQTVYSTCPGSIAAPTAGLHFDNVLIDKLVNLGIEIAFITLHVGSATFRPVRSKIIEHHIMYDEYISVSQNTVESVLSCRKRGNRVIAVGTTVVKALETASIFSKNNLVIEPYCGYARTFIIPGYRFRIVDSLITNFHLPQSTLIMLVAAFAGYRNTLNAYHEAIQFKYKFLSYGDAMFIMNNLNSLY